MNMRQTQQPRRSQHLRQLNAAGPWFMENDAAASCLSSAETEGSRSVASSAAFAASRRLTCSKYSSSEPRPHRLRFLGLVMVSSESERRTPLTTLAAVGPPPRPVPST